MTLLHRLNANRNERRFYLVTIQPTLLDPLAVVRTWGRIGGWSQTKIDPCVSREQAEKLAARLVQRKIKRGYKIVDKGEKTMTDPNLTKHLAQLADLANQAGAEGIWLLRGATKAILSFNLQDEDGQLVPLAAEIEGIRGVLNVEVVSNLTIADVGVLVVIRFPASDGGEPGIESR